MATGGWRGVYHRAVREKTHNVLRSPFYQSTSTVSHGVSERSAQPCKLRWRFPLGVSGRACLGAAVPAGDKAPHPSASGRP